MRKTIVCLCVAGLLASGAALAADKKPAATHSWLEKHYDSLDNNHDGKLSEKEYLSHLKYKKHGEVVFKKIDTNHNGSVSFAEYEAYRKQLAAAYAKAHEAKMVKTKAAAVPAATKKP